MEKNPSPLLDSPRSSPGRLAQALADLLPSGCREVRVVQALEPELVSELKALKIEIQQIDSHREDLTASPSPLSWIGSKISPLDASRLRALSPDGGRLAILWWRRDDLPKDGTDRRRALLEAGFALRAQGEDQELRWLDARAIAFTLRTAEARDENEILDLFQRSFHHRRSSAQWRWLYLDNPVENPRAPQSRSDKAPRHISLAFDKEELVAHYAGFPMCFVDARDPNAPRRLIALQVGDTMTAQRVRSVGRGPTSVLSRCARHFYASFSEQQVAFNYGVNEGNIQRFTLRYLSGQKVRDLTYWQLDLAAGHRPSVHWAHQHQHEHQPRRRLRQIHDVRELDERFDRLFSQLAPSLGIAVERSAERLRWRYFQRPGFQYHLYAAFEDEELMGWCVLRRDGHRLLWGDALLPPRGFRWVVTGALNQALQDGLGDGADYLAGWFSAHQPPGLGSWLTQLGFLRQPEPQDLGWICLGFEEPDAPQLLRDAYLTLGDSDLF
ncbi:MAG: hypothetical protein AAGD01_00325 [Acidobacteriota bacterium]